MVPKYWLPAEVAALGKRVGQRPSPYEVLRATAKKVVGNTRVRDLRPDLYRYAECAIQVCGPEPYITTNQPRTLGVRFGQKF